MRDMYPVVVARVAEPGTATEPMRFGALGVEPRDRKESDQASCWSSGPRGFKSHPGRLHTNLSAVLLHITQLHQTLHRIHDNSERLLRYLDGSHC